MMHAITNHGPSDIKATDANGIVWTIPPGSTSQLNVVRIWHGDSRANYTVAPILPDQEKSE